MITLRPAHERGHANHGWLDSYHTFSFANYYDPAHMGFRALRVINEDWIAPSKGFAAHSHRDMEILTYVLAGSLEHKDSLGNGEIIRPGDVQRMTAGTGVTHSEYNASDSELVHLLQIWILPNVQGLTPGYEQKNFPVDQRQGQLRLVASPTGQDGSVLIHQDLKLYATLLAPGEKVVHHPDPDRHLWVQVAQGEIVLNQQPLKAGDGLELSETSLVQLEGVTPSEVLIFDLS